jgi:hypothetical protein
MPQAAWKPGEWVVYRKQKASPAPGPRARQVTPAEKGEVYHYLVDKYWVVCQVRAEGNVLLRTRRGKTHVVRSDDPRLRRARWWERWFLAARFPRLDEKGRDPSSDSESEPAQV